MRAWRRHRARYVLHTLLSALAPGDERALTASVRRLVDMKAESVRAIFNAFDADGTLCALIVSVDRARMCMR
jgi:hypothetical protein